MPLGIPFGRGGKEGQRLAKGGMASELHRGRVVIKQGFATYLCLCNVHLSSLCMFGLTP